MIVTLLARPGKSSLDFKHGAKAKTNFHPALILGEQISRMLLLNHSMKFFSTKDGGIKGIYYRALIILFI